MARATGLGGFFFKSEDPERLKAWYREHLDLPAEGEGGAYNFVWRDRDEPDRKGYTVWGPFRADTSYFAPSEKPFMFNFRVDDLDGVLARLRDAGVEVDDRVEEYEFGRFGWCMDPEGNRIELWEPTDVVPDE